MKGYSREWLAGLQRSENMLLRSTREDPVPMKQRPDDDHAAIGPFERAWRVVAGKTITRPETWDEFIGNTHTINVIREAVEAAKIENRHVDHILLFGAAGVGKTSLSRLIARDLGSECFETTASTLETPADVIRLMIRMNAARERLQKPSVLFVDEIHMLGNARGRAAIDQESIYPLLEDWTFFHNMAGRKIIDDTTQGDDPEDTTKRILTKNYMLAWPFTCIGATTEPGILSPALLRRFLLQIELEPYTEDNISEIIYRACRRLTWEISEEAAQYLAKFSRLNPGRARSLMQYARNRAITQSRPLSDDELATALVDVSATGTVEITQSVAAEVVERLKLYPEGLNDTDVRVLNILAERYPKGSGQAELSRAAGISLNQFTNMMEPYLRQLGLVETLNRRVITIKGLKYLDELGRLNRKRPELRAILKKLDDMVAA